LGRDVFLWSIPDETKSFDSIHNHKWKLEDISPGREGGLWLDSTLEKQLPLGFDSQRQTSSTATGQFLDCLINVGITPRERFRALMIFITAEETTKVKPVEVYMQDCNPRVSWLTQPGDVGWIINEPLTHTQYSFSARIRVVSSISLSKMIYKPKVTITAIEQELESTFLGSSAAISDQTLGNVTLALKDTYSGSQTWQTRRELVYLTVSTGTDNLTDTILQNIEKHKKGDIRLRILDRNLKPVTNVNVEIRQLRHDFLFGCSYPREWRLKGIEAKFRELFAALFNFAVTENDFKWTFLEPSEGKVDWGPIDRFLLWAKSKEIKVAGHCLVWGDSPRPGYVQGGSGVPPWLLVKTRNEVRRLLETRIRQTMTKYAGEVAVWDIVNEPIHKKWFDHNFGDDYVELSYKWARESDSRALLRLNEDRIIISPSVRQHFIELVARLKSKTVPLDLIGLQEHHESTWLSPMDIYEGLDVVSALGYDIHITEFDVEVAGQPIRGGFKKGVWNEQSQAEYFEMFYRTAFSHPKVRAITTWELMDHPDYLKNSGLVRSDLTPRPVYATLDRLINKEWRTNLQTITAHNGTTTFRGFYGTYELSSAVDGEKLTASFHLGEHGPRELEVVLTKAGPELLKPSELQRYLLPVAAVSIPMIVLLFTILRRAAQARKKAESA